jgi:RimJ/RimL family protein N-acetyltransferase
MLVFGYGEAKMTIIATGDNILLRDGLKSDIDRYIYWWTHGEWRFLDAPWDGFYTSLTAEQEANFRVKFLESYTGGLPSPRKTVIIATNDNQPLGWVIRSGQDRTPDTWTVGIAICEDDALNKGLGTEALNLWVDYLFANSTQHRIGLDTWSFNPRMIHVAEKLGFVLESRQREVIQWDGKWLDLIHFGMLRSEWEEKRT